MKRLFAFMMAAMLICSLGVVAASANNSNKGTLLISTYVRSPERPGGGDHDDDKPEIPDTPVDPEIPDEPVPGDPVPGDPEVPVDPEVPGEPEVPADPEVPGQPGGSDEPAVPGEDEPGSTPPETPEQEDPEGEIPGVPVAPQTGYTVGILGLSAAAAASGAVAVAAGKKAKKN